MTVTEPSAPIGGSERRVVAMRVNPLDRHGRSKRGLIRRKIIVHPVSGREVGVAGRLHALQDLERARLALRACRRWHVPAELPEDVRETFVAIAKVLAEAGADALG